MLGLIRCYTRWLHTRWPAGTVEQLPVVRDDYSTNVPGVYITGDLTGIPLLKFSSDTGARTVRTIVNDPVFQRRSQQDQVLDLLIIGAGVSGVAAMAEAKKHDLRAEVIDASQPLSTIIDFPKGKPIFTYPTDMTPAGELQFSEKADVKEGLVEELQAFLDKHTIEPRTARAERIERSGGILTVHLTVGEPIRAHRIIIAIGRSGNFRSLGVPGEDSDKVYKRLHDPADFCGQRALVVGGGDSALEAAIALTRCGAEVTLSYRRAEFSRAKPDNIEHVLALTKNPEAAVDVEHPSSERESSAAGDWMRTGGTAGSLRLIMSSEVKEIRPDGVELTTAHGTETIENDVVFAMIGREAPLDFFRRSGIRIHGERTGWWWISLIAFLLICIFIYHWKKPNVTIINVPPISWVSEIGDAWAANGWFPYNIPDWWASLGAMFQSPAHLLGTLTVSLGEPGFYYSFAYCLCVLLFGIDRMRRRRTPYVRVQTITLTLIQIVPLFLLPYVLLPWLGNNGAFDGGFLQTAADNLFPQVNYGHGREYWRAFGFILAWPLFIWNVFTDQPLWWWLSISFVQTFIVIPFIIWRWGKGAYCGWICSCGALAETMGDRHRQKMPHGAVWNRVNMIGQAFMVFAFVLVGFRTIGWIMGETSFASRAFNYLLNDIPGVNYVWFVDLFWAGILGVGLYFWFSGRVWCRFACPLAALMHIYTRFSQFRILAEKKKCISCNVCTSVCHQGIDIMNFANKGEAMADPQCVRCSACVQMCPTGVLSFGRVNRNGDTIGEDPRWLAASPVRMAELTVNGKHAKA